MLILPTVIALMLHLNTFGCTENTSNVEVTVRQGKLKGEVKHLPNGSIYYSFKGVPYAKAPTGEQRFMAPLPPESWEYTYDATGHGPVCIQFDTAVGHYIAGSEECLFVNIYTKSLDSRSKIPVMVFIHGGGFTSGNGNAEYGFGPEILLQHDVILVTMNYRLELLGFLNLDIPEVPGNAALKDQVAALRWIKNNIAKFGGDPDNVTIFGESSGAACAIYHMHSPMSKGLFHKVIAQSGVTMADISQGKDEIARAFRAGKSLGIDTSDVNELLHFLRDLPASKVTNLTDVSMTEEEKNRGIPEHFAPIVEKKFHNVEAFLTEDVDYSIVNKKLNAVPLMIGYNSEEAILMLSFYLTKLDFFNQNPEYLVPVDIASRLSKDETREIGERIKNYYADNKDFTANDRKQLVKMVSDRLIVYSTHRFTHYFSKMYPSVYLYRFSCDTDLNFVKKSTGVTDIEGASHADELFYLFYSRLNKKPYDEQPKLRELTYRVSKLWTNFAKTGNPTPDKRLGVTWKPYSSTDKNFLDINQRFTPGVNAELDRVEFWDQLYCEAGLPCVTKK